MSYQSFSFILFSFAVVGLFYIVPKKLQKYVLLVANIFFYAYAGASYVPLLAATLFASFFTGKAIGKIYDKEALLLKECTEVSQKKEVRANSKKQAKKMLIIAFTVTVGLLVICKYTGFIVENINSLLGLIGITPIKTFSIILPLGISFYTFMAISYVLDVYWKRYKAEQSIINYTVFLTYFPHIVQGPIDRYNLIKAQIPDSGIAFSSSAVAKGAQLMLWGLIKKLVIADRLNIFVGEIYDNYSSYAGVILIIATVLYSIQIYADFSGCIDIVSGVSEMLGIKLKKNFDHPYFSKDIPEFWRRWHISLGEWFKDYIYYPLSISKFVKKTKKNMKSKRGAELFAACFPIFVVWITTGTWHGASWNFIAWGLFYAFIMIVGTIFEPTGKKITSALKIKTESFPYRLFQMTRTFIICCIGRVFFRAPGLKAAASVFAGMFSGIHPEFITDGKIFTYGLDYKNFVLVLLSIALLWIIDLLQEKMSIRDKLESKNIVIRWTLLIGAILFVLVFGIYGPGYDASSFIYEQF